MRKSHATLEKTCFACNNPFSLCGGLRARFWRLTPPLGNERCVGSHVHSNIVDFHNHHIPARFEQTAARTQPGKSACPLGSACARVAGRGPFAEGHPRGPLARVSSTYLLNLIADAEGRVPHETIMAMNDDLAGLVARYPGQHSRPGARSMRMMATGLPVRRSAPSAILDCAGSSSTARAAIS